MSVSDQTTPTKKLNIDDSFYEVLKSELTLQLDIHGDVREAAQHSHDLIVLLLPKETQHAASVRVLQTHKVLQGPHLILQRRPIRGQEEMNS